MNTGQWAEKHGTGGKAILHGKGENPDMIPWEFMWDPDFYNSDIIYYAISK
jgi:hypothetical protein